MDTPDETMDDLMDRVQEALQGRDRIVVAIAGPPGSGKSTLARRLVDHLSERGIAADLFPMDGFHLDNKTLEQRGLLHRKGAPQTFDVEGFRDVLERIRVGGTDIPIPIFDRDQDAVLRDADKIEATTQVVVAEGNYLLLDQAPWKSLGAMFDVTIYLRVDEEVLRERLIRRWLDQGMTLETSRSKALNNDIPNARLVAEGSTVADIVL